MRDASPYIASLLDSTTTETGSLITRLSSLLFGTPARHIALNGPLYAIEAFNKVVDYMYSTTKNYSVDIPFNTPLRVSETALAHARVFLLAGRLGMNDLEKLAFKKIKGLMVESFKNSTGNRFWHADNLSKIIDLVYSHTYCTLVDTGIIGRPPFPPIYYMRKLLARYSAFWLPTLRKENSFKEVMEVHTDFLREMLSSLQPAPSANLELLEEEYNL